MNPFIQFLSQFITLEESETKLLEQALIHKHFKAGDKILEAKSICRNINFIISGKARSYFINHEGQEYTWYFHFNDADSTFENYFLVDYNSFLTQTPTFLTLQAVEDLDAIVLSYDAIEKLASQAPFVEKIAGKMSAIAYQNVHKRAFSLLTLNAKERYLQLIKEESYLLNKFQHYLIASYLGVAPQSLSRLRKEIIKS